MDPMIEMIYRTYFDREHWRVVGTPEEISLLSAMQMRYWHTPEPAYQVPAPSILETYEKDVARDAFEFIKKYSTYSP